MKQILSLILCLISLLSCDSNSKEEKVNVNRLEKINLIGNNLPQKDSLLTFEVVQRLNVDLNFDGIEDQILLEKIKESKNPKNNKIYEWTDPGEFHRVTLSLKNHDNLTLLNKEGGWVKNNGLFKYGKELEFENIVKSDLLLVKKVSEDNIIVILRGYAYASSPGLLTIINIYHDKPVLVFNVNTELYGLEDFNKDGVLDICTTVWNNYYQDAEKNKYRFKVYLLNGGLELNEEYSNELSERIFDNK